MAIIQTINNASQFRDEFHRCGRGEQFSYEGLGILFDYLDDMGEDVELDVIALCCDFYEDSTSNIASDYRIDVEGLDEDEITEAVRQYLEDEGVLIGEVEGGFVYRSH